MGERKQGSSEAAERAKPVSGSETARKGKDAETLPMVDGQMVDGPMAEE